MRDVLPRARIHVRQTVLQRSQLVAGHQIGLADEDLVGKAHLAARFLALIELLHGVLGIDQGHDGVQQILLGHFVVHEKSLRHGARVGQAGGFDDHALEVERAAALAGGQIGQGGAQVFADGAAHAAVVHLHDLLFVVAHQNVVVDVLLAKLVFDDGNLLPVRLGQHAPQQRGFAGAEKAGEDGGGDEGHWMHKGRFKRARSVPPHSRACLAVRHALKPCLQTVNTAAGFLLFR